MASPSTPTHGILGNIYVLRPNNFKGSGLNDCTLGAYSSASDSSHFEIVIDANGTPDTFKWRENGGGWTTGVAITGASQDIAGANGTQAITFAATTGHTIGDQWTIGNLYAEPTTESSAEAQITDAALRLLNPNAPPTWTDDGGETVLQLDNTRGWAEFSDTVGNVTVAGDNGYILESGLQQVGYIKGWTLDVALDMADASRMGQKWKEFISGQAGATGSIEKMLIANQSFWELLEDCADGTQNYFLLQLFNYDPDQDQTGDHFNLWVTFTNFSSDQSPGDVAKSNIQFQVHGAFSFTANT